MCLHLEAAWSATKKASIRRVPGITKNVEL